MPTHAFAAPFYADATAGLKVCGYYWDRGRLETGDYDWLASARTHLATSVKLAGFSNVAAAWSSSKRSVSAPERTITGMPASDGSFRCASRNLKPSMTGIRRSRTITLAAPPPWRYVSACWPLSASTTDIPSRPRKRASVRRTPESSSTSRTGWSEDTAWRLYTPRPQAPLFAPLWNTRLRKRAVHGLARHVC